jgi:hypothetical protein
VTPRQSDEAPRSGGRRPALASVRVPTSSLRHSVASSLPPNTKATRSPRRPRGPRTCPGRAVPGGGAAVMPKPHRIGTPLPRPASGRAARGVRGEVSALSRSRPGASALPSMFENRQHFKWLPVRGHDPKCRLTVEVTGWEGQPLVARAVPGPLLRPRHRACLDGNALRARLLSPFPAHHPGGRSGLYARSLKPCPASMAGARPHEFPWPSSALRLTPAPVQIARHDRNSVRFAHAHPEIAYME